MLIPLRKASPSQYHTQTEPLAASAAPVAESSVLAAFYTRIIRLINLNCIGKFKLWAGESVKCIGTFPWEVSMRGKGFHFQAFVLITWKWQNQPCNQVALSLIKEVNLESIKEQLICWCQWLWITLIASKRWPCDRQHFSQCLKVSLCWSVTLTDIPLGNTLITVREHWGRNELKSICLLQNYHS